MKAKKRHQRALLAKLLPAAARTSLPWELLPLTSRIRDVLPKRMIHQVTNTNKSNIERSGPAPYPELLVMSAKLEHREDMLNNETARSFQSAMEDALRAQPHLAHTPAGMHEPTAYIRQSTTRSIALPLRTGNLPSLFDREGRLIRTPTGTIAGQAIKLEAGLIANSRVAGAGAHVVVYPEATHAISMGKTGEVAMQSLPMSFRNIEAALFGTVADDADAPTIPLPVLGTPIDWKLSIAKAVHFDIKYRDRKSVNVDDLCAEIMVSLTLGLARAADEILLSALNAAGLNAFTIAKAAAQGVLFGELRGLIGTNGAGAVVSQDGNLRAAGIASEITGDMAGTIVGAWNRSGVAIKDDVIVTFDRRSTKGDLAVTAFANMIPLVPDASKFWTVA